MTGIQELKGGYLVQTSGRKQKLGWAAPRLTEQPNLISIFQPDRSGALRPDTLANSVTGHRTTGKWGRLPGLSQLPASPAVGEGSLWLDKLGAG